MDVSSISASSAAQSAAQPSTALVLEKKAQEIQKETAEQLIQSVPDPSSPKGQNIDVTA